MFATLVGHEIWPGADPVKIANFASALADQAARAGFKPAQQQDRIIPDQAPLDQWRIALLSPGEKEADFLLAVIQPEVPMIAPLPCRNPTIAPMFAVIVFEHFFVVSSAMTRDVVEFATFEEVEGFFARFLDGLPMLRHLRGLA